MDKIKNIKCAEVTQNEIKFAVYHTSEFLPYMDKFNTPHKHDYFMILINEKGTGSQLIDFQECKIEPKTATCMHFGQIHQWIDYTQIEGYLLFFEKDFFITHYQNYQLNEFSYLSYQHQHAYCTLDEEAFQKVKKTVECILDEYTKKQAYYEKSLRSLLDILLIDLNRVFESNDFKIISKSSVILVRQFEKMIDQSFKNRHLVKEYAINLNVSPNYLNAICKEITGFSAGELIQQRIILEAKRILLHESKTVSEIAFELGFEDNSYFGRFFKRSEAVTPNIFRKSLRNL